MIKLLYPPTKEAVIRYLERDPRSPNLSREFASEWASWAYDQVRRGTPEGRALAPCIQKYQGIDPKKDNFNSPAVQRAIDRYLLIKNTRNSQEALAKLHSLEEMQNVMSQGVQDFRQQLTIRERKAEVEAVARKELADRVRVYQNLSGSLELTSYIFTISGNPSAARTARGLADAAGGVANLK